MYKKIIAAILCFGAVCGISASAEPDDGIPSWAAEAVDYCLENDILKGDEKGNLMLTDELTQAQAIALLNRTFDVPEIEGKVNIPKGHWATKEIERLSGYLLRPADFNAESVATREMYIATLMRVAGIPESNKVYNLKKNYKDYSEIYKEYLMHMTAAVLEGYVQGSEGKLFPKDNLTRAEAVTMMYRVKTSDKVTTPALSKSSTKIKGAAMITVDKAKAWAKSKGAHQRYIDIADIYWKYGEITGIRPEVMYAQAGRETGFGKYGGRVLPEMNNWAGIKRYGAVGDETDDHETFATPDDGVRAHYNHMGAYVGVDPVGETHGRYKSVKSLEWAGTITDVPQLGGKWCPDPEYGNLVMDMVREMIG